MGGNRKRHNSQHDEKLSDHKRQRRSSSFTEHNRSDERSEDPDTLDRNGDRYERDGRYADAARSFERSAKIRIKNSINNEDKDGKIRKVCRLAADSFQKLKEYDKAAEWFYEASQYYPEDEWRDRESSLNNAANCYKKKEETKRVVKCLMELIELRQRHKSGFSEERYNQIQFIDFNKLKNLFHNLSSNEDKVQFLIKFIKLKEQNRSLFYESYNEIQAKDYNRLAVLLQSLNMHREAADCFKKSMTHIDNPLERHLSLIKVAESYEAIKDFGRAAEFREKAANEVEILNKDHWGNNMHKAYVNYIECGNAEDALRCANKLIQADRIPVRKLKIVGAEARQFAVNNIDLAAKCTSDNEFKDLCKKISRQFYISGSLASTDVVESKIHRIRDLITSELYAEYSKGLPINPEKLVSDIEYNLKDKLNDPDLIRQLKKAYSFETERRMGLAKENGFTKSVIYITLGRQILKLAQLAKADKNFKSANRFFNDHYNVSKAQHQDNVHAMPSMLHGIREIGQNYAELGNYDQALNMYDRSIKMAEAELPRIKALYSKANNSDELKNLKEKTRFIEKELEIACGRSGTLCKKYLGRDLDPRTQKLIYNRIGNYFQASAQHTNKDIAKHAALSEAIVYYYKAGNKKRERECRQERSNIKPLNSQDHRLYAEHYRKNDLLAVAYVYLDASTNVDSSPIEQAQCALNAYRFFCYHCIDNNKSDFLEDMYLSKPLKKIQGRLISIFHKTKEDVAIEQEVEYSKKILYNNLIAEAKELDIDLSLINKLMAQYPGVPGRIRNSDEQMDVQDAQYNDQSSPTDLIDISDDESNEIENIVTSETVRDGISLLNIDEPPVSTDMPESSNLQTTLKIIGQNLDSMHAFDINDAEIKEKEREFDLKIEQAEARNKKERLEKEKKEKLKEIMKYSAVEDRDDYHQMGYERKYYFYDDEKHKVYIGVPRLTPKGMETIINNYWDKHELDENKKPKSIIHRNRRLSAGEYFYNPSDTKALFTGLKKYIAERLKNETKDKLEKGIKEKHKTFADFGETFILQAVNNHNGELLHSFCVHVTMVDNTLKLFVEGSAGETVDGSHISAMQEGFSGIDVNTNIYVPGNNNHDLNRAMATQLDISSCSIQAAYTGSHIAKKLLDKDPKDHDKYLIKPCSTQENIKPALFSRGDKMVRVHYFEPQPTKISQNIKTRPNTFKEDKYLKPAQYLNYSNVEKNINYNLKPIKFAQKYLNVPTGSSKADWRYNKL